MSPTRARHIVRGLGLFAILMFAAAIGLTLGDPTTDAGELPDILIMATGITAFAVIGLTIAARAPNNPIGWLYAATGISMIALIATNEYAIRGLTDLDLPWTGQVQLLSALLVVPAVASFLMALLLFPTGHPPSRRWRVVGWAIAAGSLLAVIGTGLQQEVFEVAADLRVPNPAHVPALASWTWFGAAAAIVLAGGALGAFAAVVVRFRRARGDERQQLRWLAYAVCLVAVALVPLVVADGTRLADVAWFAFITSLLFGVPVATAIAMLRYRLYDLDLVIKKTVIFALTVVLVMAGGIGVLFAISSPITDLAPDETQAVGLRARDRRADLADVATRSPGRRPPRLRRTGHAVRSADGVLGAIVRGVRDRRRVAQDGGRARRERAGSRGARLAARRQVVPPGGRLAGLGARGGAGRP